MKNLVLAVPGPYLIELASLAKLFKNILLYTKALLGSAICKAPPAAYSFQLTIPLSSKIEPLITTFCNLQIAIAPPHPRVPLVDAMIRFPVKEELSIIKVPENIDPRQIAIAPPKLLTLLT